MLVSIALPLAETDVPAVRTEPGTPRALAGFAGSLAGEPVLRIAADGEIYAEGEAADCFYQIVSGVVRTCKFLHDGQRRIDAFYHADEIFGFEPGADHRLTAEAVSECTLVPYRRDGAERLAAGDERFATTLLSQVMRCLVRSQDHALMLGRGGAARKLAAFLLEMAAVRTGDAAIELAMTRQDVADYLGLTIETVSRTLSQLERDGVIALPSARRIVLKDRAMLRWLNT